MVAWKSGVKGGDLSGLTVEENPPFTCRHEWPQWQAQDLSRFFPTLEAEGVDLMQKMMEYDPARRISVRPSWDGCSLALPPLCSVSLCMGTGASRLTLASFLPAGKGCSEAPLLLHPGQRDR